MKAARTIQALWLAGLFLLAAALPAEARRVVIIPRTAEEAAENILDGFKPDGMVPGDRLPAYREFANFNADRNQSSRPQTFRGKAYLGKYAGGNWDAQFALREGQIVRGALPNLCYLVHPWSKSRFELECMRKPLALDSAEIFVERPLYIYLCGSRDFVLTEAEVVNLRRYISVGGAIWGDNSLPGAGQDFADAFRREMGRVMNRPGFEFRPLPKEHPIFTKMKFYLRDVPPKGLQFSQDPVEGVTLYSQVCILYTPNGYGTQMGLGLDPDGKLNMGKDMNGDYVAHVPAILNHGGLYTNMDEKALANTYEFGVNVLHYFANRWWLR